MRAKPPEDEGKVCVDIHSSRTYDVANLNLKAQVSLAGTHRSGPASCTYVLAWTVTYLLVLPLMWYHDDVKDPKRHMRDGGKYVYILAYRARLRALKVLFISKNHTASSDALAFYIFDILCNGPAAVQSSVRPSFSFLLADL